MSSARPNQRVALLSDSVAYLAILFALADSKTPLTQAEISKQAGLQRQHVHYHIKSMIADGVVVTVPNGDQKTYALQEFFRDEDQIDHTYKLMEHLVWLIRKGMSFDEVPKGGFSMERALSNNVAFFCYLFARDVAIAEQTRK